MENNFFKITDEMDNRSKMAYKLASEAEAKDHLAEMTLKRIEEMVPEGNRSNISVGAEYMFLPDFGKGETRRMYRYVSFRLYKPWIPYYVDTPYDVEFICIDEDLLQGKAGNKWLESMLENLRGKTERFEEIREEKAEECAKAQKEATILFASVEALS